MKTLDFTMETVLSGKCLNSKSKVRSLRVCDDTEETGTGVFLGDEDIISKFDPELRAHNESLNKGNIISYFTRYTYSKRVSRHSSVKKQI